MQCKNHILPFGLHMTTTQIWAIGTNGGLSLLSLSSSFVPSGVIDDHHESLQYKLSTLLYRCFSC